IEILNRIYNVYEKTGLEAIPYFLHVQNCQPDAFTSIQTRSDPVKAKKLLIALSKKYNSYPQILSKEIIYFNLSENPTIQLKDPLLKELLENIRTMGKALMEQFDAKDPN